MGVIESFPNEILAKIFAWGTEMWAVDAPSTRPFPLLISAVNVHWYTLVYNTPCLWAYVNVPFSQKHIDVVAWTSSWLQRSKAHPLSILLDIPGLEGRMLDDVKAILHLICYNINRLRSFVLHNNHGNIHPSELLSTLLDSPIEAPNLECLKLLVRRPGSEPFRVADSGVSMTSIFNAAPRLHSLALMGIDTPFRLSNLNTLTLHSLQITYEGFSILMNGSPRLSCLVLVDLYPLNSTPDSINHEFSPIVAPSLSSLAVSFSQCSSHSHSYSLKYLSLPKLRYLELDRIVNFHAVFGNSLSCSTIKTLRLSNIYRCSVAPSPSDKKCYDPQFAHLLSSVRHLQLIQVPVKGLLRREADHGTIRRRVSVAFRQPKLRHDALRSALPQGPADTIFYDRWPQLQTITLDTLLADEVVWLCELVSKHPGIRIVELSSIAQRHLLSSVKRIGKDTFEVPSFLSPRRFDWEVEGKSDADDWLRNRVHVKKIDPSDVGLIQQDYIPIDRF